MNATTLASYANISLYSAMAVLTLSMLGYAAYLAGSLPARDRAGAEQLPADRELVGAGAPRSGPKAPTVAAGTPDAAAALAAGSDGAGQVGARARKAGGVAGSFAWLATLLIAASVVMRGLAVHRAPLGNIFEFVTMASLFVMIVFCAWSTRRDLRWLGIFVVAPVLLMLGAAITIWYTEAAELMPSLKSYWLVIHVTVATLSVAVFTLAAVVTGLYLLVDRAERGDSMRRLARLLPGSRELERLGYGMHIVAFPLWTFTLIAGAIWARQAWASYWNWDPKEVWTFIIWVVYAAYLHARVTTGISRQRTAWIALAGFACIVANYAIVNMYFVGQHSYSGL